jgi:hypothetical protein
MQVNAEGAATEDNEPTKGISSGTSRSCIREYRPISAEKQPGFHKGSS